MNNLFDGKRNDDFSVENTTEIVLGAIAIIGAIISLITKLKDSDTDEQDPFEPIKWRD